MRTVIKDQGEAGHSFRGLRVRQGKEGSKKRKKKVKSRREKRKEEKSEAERKKGDRRVKEMVQ